MKKIQIFIITLFCSMSAIAGIPPDSMAYKLVEAAKERTAHDVTYNGRYTAIEYPGGDVPSNIGVCTDLVIRSFRQLGIDLQKKVHEDMLNNFSLYPSEKIWGLKHTDSNIDHRRVPNLGVFFTRAGKRLTITQKPEDYLPGDLVTWMLTGNLPHIGIIIDKKSAHDGVPLVAHNIGNGPEISNILFSHPITGHYRYPANEK
ncbi:MAG TPA: DUF1287 domain-containing protein [Gammaproteobacteria bacterium]|nr:DUF1287 domain-containing protein [Gammaproteobacteria bacterium]